MAPPRRLTRSERAEQAVRSVQAKLPTSLATVIGSATGSHPPTAFGVLRAWRRLGRTANITPHDRTVLRQGFIAAVTKLLHESGGKATFTPRDFGVRGYAQLAELFLTMLDRVGYARRSLSEVRRIRDSLIGEMLEVLVRNASELQSGLLNMAVNQLRLMRTRGAALVDAAGSTIVVKTFREPVKAIDAVIIGPGGQRKFVDFGYVSVGELPDGRRCLTYLVETEIRMPTKAKKAGKQIGQAQMRFDMVAEDRLVLNVEGHGPLEFRANEIVFLPTSIDRMLVTIGNTEKFSLRSTRAGGYTEVFWQVVLEMKAASVRSLVDLAVPRPSLGSTPARQR